MRARGNRDPARRTAGKRPSWDRYFMEMAWAVSRRSTCLRRQMGAVLVRDKRILCTGYNGAPAGLPHCEEVGCRREELGIRSGERPELCRGLHAEQNAIVQAALHGVSLRDGVLYCTNQPCVICAKMLINAGVRRIVFEVEYPDELAVELLREAGVELAQLEPEGKGEGRSADLAD
jgi:dCMP deaminase